MIEAFIGIGSNIGERQKNLKKAITYIDAHQKITVEKVSSFIDTLPVGGPPQGNYLNGVIKIKTTLSPYDLLVFLQSIEKKLGRKRTVRFGPRTIDLDIILYGEERIDTPYLKVPHPRMQEREFVLKPLFEIAPQLKKILAGSKK